ncbi:MAG: fructose-bisphosphatase class II [Capsulimonadales bacterium]|nr:fructose-bisphosphatase class II [Capsulimonadales bacterium]
MSQGSIEKAGPLPEHRSVSSLEREIVNILAHTTSVTALNAAHARGRNQPHLANRLAVTAMRETLDQELPLCGEVVIGEGLGDRNPHLFIGERLGPGAPAPHLSLAVDPLEGIRLCARGEPGAVTVIAAALSGEGQLMGGLEGYLDKIVIGRDLAEKVSAMRRKYRILRQRTGPGDGPDLTDGKGLLDNPVEDVVRWIARERGKSVTEVVAMALERQRNSAMVERLRALNTQVLLIRDGDITAGLLALDPDREVDIALGIGSAPEGVITAAICRVFQGYMEARSWFGPTEQVGPSTAPLLTAEDLASGHVMFALTGITYNQYTPGVKYQSGGTAVTHTIYGRSRSGTVYERKAIHQSPPPPPDFSDWNHASVSGNGPGPSG